jgi:hypothetical protein
LILEKYDINKKPIDEIYYDLQEEIDAYVHYPNLLIAYLDESTTRENNMWSLDTYSKRLKWDLEMYDMTMYKGRNIRASDPQLMRTKLYRKYLKFFS